MTVDAWFNYWITEIKGKTLRWNTIKSYKYRYENNIKKLIGDMLISNIKPMHCQNILNEMDNQGYMEGSMKITKITMYAMFSSAYENDIIVTNPVTKNVKCPKREKKNTKVLTIEEQEKFLSVAKKVLIIVIFFLYYRLV